MSILALIAQEWALEHGTMAALAAIVARHSADVRLSEAAIREVVSARDEARAASRPFDSVLANRPAADQKAGFYKSGNVAVVPIEGMLAARAGMVNNVSSPPGMSAEEVIRSVTNAAASGASAMVLHIDSPGGTVAGTSDMVQAVREAAAKMPVVAFGNDRMGSGAYWLATAATAIMAAPLAQVGSIGVYTAIPDSSRAMESAGVRVHIVKRGEYKAAGAPGVPVSEKDLASIQAQIDRIYHAFVSAVGEARGMTHEQALAVADGRTHIGPDALAMNLIDKIGTLQEAVAYAASLAGRPQPRNSAMTLDELKIQQPALVAALTAEVTAAAQADEATRIQAAVKTAREEAVAAERARKPGPATRAQLKAIVPEALADREALIGRMQDEEATEGEAREAVLNQLTAENASLRERLIKAESLEAGHGGRGVRPLAIATKADEPGFAGLVRRVAAEKKCSMNEAIVHAQKIDPQAHREWVSEGAPAIAAA